MAGGPGLLLLKTNGMTVRLVLNPVLHEEGQKDAGLLVAEPRHLLRGPPREDR